MESNEAVEIEVEGAEEEEMVEGEVAITPPHTSLFSGCRAPASGEGARPPALQGGT